MDTIAHIKTEALCGYSFDFATLGSESQDVNSISYSNSSLHIPSQEEHEEIVFALREASRPYWALQQLVRAIALFRDWHAEEEKLIKSVNLNHFIIIQTYN